MTLAWITRDELDALHNRIDELRAEKALLTRKQHDLTPAEMRALVMIAQGYSDHQIAARYHLSDSTVRTRMSRVYDKLQVKNRIHAALWAWRNGIVCPDEAWETVKRMQREK